MIKRAICNWLLAVCCVAAIGGVADGQETRPQLAVQPIPEGAEVRIIRAKHNPKLVEAIIQGFQGSLLTWTLIDHASGLFTATGAPEALTRLEEVVAKYDRPTKNIELTFYLVEGSNDGATSELPKALESVVAELQRTLVYKTYRVVYPVSLRVRDGGTAENMGAIQAQPAPQGIDMRPGPGYYRVTVEGVRLQGEENAQVVSVQNLAVELKGPEQIVSVRTSDGNTGIGREPGPQSKISTGVDIPVDQTIVVGKASDVTSGEDRAIFVVLSARVAD